MKFEKTEVWGFEHAIRGCRNPLESWKKSDSGYGCYDGAISLCKDCDSEKNKYCQCKEFVIGKNDLDLMQRLIRAGSEHRKFMRQIMVSIDITAPLYWWKEFSTYKIGTVANSTSTMHKLASTPITVECFEMGDFSHLIDNFKLDITWNTMVQYLEQLRQGYNETKDKRYWKELIRLLPESWLQTRTITMNYENVLNMYQQRCVHPHKLSEWSVLFKGWVESLPYAKELLCISKEMLDGQLARNKR